MQKKICRQYDSQWGSLPYPTKKINLADAGCGCLSVYHCAIENPLYKNLTVKKCWKYMKRFSRSGQGTDWSGIKKGLEHYGYTVHWDQSDSMSDIFKALKNSTKIGVILFHEGKAPNGTVWTTSGHYVAFTDYKVTKDGRHLFYTKDSGPRNLDGWHSYENTMKGCIKFVYVCKKMNKPKATTTNPTTSKPSQTTTKPTAKTPQDKICAEAKSIADSKKYRYMRYDEKPYGKQCPMCHPHDGKNDGTQCIGFAVMCWHHSGIKCKCKPDVFTNQIYNKMLKGSAAAATKTAQERLGIQDVKVIKNGDKTLVFDKLQKGDIVVYFKSDEYRHTAIYIGDGKIADCTSGRKQAIKYGVKSYTSMSIKLAIRYTGK